MNPDRLTSLLAANAEDDRTASSPCPDEHQLAAYVDGGLDPAARAQVELHLAECGRCLAVVSLACRVQTSGRLEQMAGATGQVDVVQGAQQQRSWRSAPRWAAAAAIVLAVPLVMQFVRDAGREEGQRHPEPLAPRTMTSRASGLRVLSPQAGTAVDARELSFRWTEVSGSPFYDVRIVTDDGEVVIEKRVTGTTWRPPAQLELRAGAEYFVHVDAYPSGDKALGSDHVPFRVAD